MGNFGTFLWGNFGHFMLNFRHFIWGNFGNCWTILWGIWDVFIGNVGHFRGKFWDTLDI